MQDPQFILPDERDLPAESASFLRWLWFFLRPYRKTFFMFTALRVVRFAVLAMMPFFIGITIKGFEEGWAMENPSRLMWMIVPYMVAYGLALISMGLFLNEAAMEDRLNRSMALFSVRHMNRLSLNWHESQGSGSKMQRITTARSSLKQLYNIYKWSLVPFVGSVIGIFASVILIDAPFYFLLLYAGFIVTFMAVGVYTARNLPKMHDRHNKMLEKLTARVYEFVGAVRTVKAFNMGAYIDEQAQRHEADAHFAMRDVFKITYFKWTVLNMTAFFWIVLTLGLCLSGMFGGWLSAGAFATVFFLMFNLWSRLEEMVYMQDQFLEYRNGFMRISETLREKPQMMDFAPAQSLPADWNDIRFNNVNFTYDGQKGHALHSINLTIPRGKTIALTGRSGAGKSTLVRMLMKQMLPETGTITVGNANLNNVPGHEWLNRIALVPQDVELFNITIRDNILLDRIDTVDEDLYQRALKHAALDELIASLPDGDATMIGERGIKLSGGQRQRLGIARAFVRDADLIIFDEATSALDSLSEQVIQTAMETAFAGKTMVIIAHRLSTVKHADNLIVMENGEIVENGGFAELLAKNGTFAKLWAMQSEHFIDGDAVAAQ